MREVAVLGAGLHPYGVFPEKHFVSMGHPLGPTGLGQIAELLWQMRGQAGGRQVPHPRLGLAHMVGAGGVCFIHILGQ